MVRIPPTSRAFSPRDDSSDEQRRQRILMLHRELILTDHPAVRKLHKLIINNERLSKSSFLAALEPFNTKKDRRSVRTCQLIKRLARLSGHEL